MPFPSRSEERILAHISTDKPVYKPNDVMFIEVFIVDAITKEPVTQINNQDLFDINYLSTLKIKNDKDSVIYEQSSNSGQNGTLVYTYKVPSDQSGGEYTVEISSYLIPTTTRKFRIRSYNSRNLFTTVDFSKEGYSPGDQVIAKVKVRRADGVRLSEDYTYISYSSQFESVTQQESEIYLNENGEVFIFFNIPHDTKQDLLTLVIQTTIQDSFSESSVHSVVIAQFKDLHLKFYPETGHLIPDIVNRVYYETLSNHAGTDVAEFSSAEVIFVDAWRHETIIVKDIKEAHIGRGVFEFTPKKLSKNEFYMFKVKWTRDSNGQRYLLPKLDLSKQVGFRVNNPVIDQNNEGRIDVTVLSSSSLDQELMFTLQLKENIIKNHTFILQLQNQTESISLENLTIPNGGILQLTLYSINRLKPHTVNYTTQQVILGERLIFAKPKEVLDLSLNLERNEYAPGDTVNFNISLDQEVEVNDTVFYSVVVTDESSFIEVPKRAIQPSLPAMVFLENEVYQAFGVSEFWYSHYYLDHIFNKEDVLDGFKNLDILLGIQDWRRYSFLETENSKIRMKIMNLEAENLEKQRYEKLFAQKTTPRYYPMRMNNIMFKAVARGGEAQEMQYNMMADNLEFGATATSVTMDGSEPEIEEEKPQSQDVLDKQTDFMNNIPENTREYTHLKRKGWSQTSERLDFTQTLKFVSAQVLQQPQSKVSFELNDQISTFRVTVTAFSLSGKYGFKSLLFSTKKPFYISYELPKNVISGDQLHIPIYLINNMDQDLEIKLSITQTNENGSKEVQEYEVSLESYENYNEQFLMKVDYLQGSKTGIEAKAVAVAEDEDYKEYSDTLIKLTEVLPNGFKQKVSKSGLIGKSNKNVDLSQSFSVNFTLPPTYLPQTLNISVAKIFAEPLDNIIAAVEALIQDPYGCFEQCSSVTYPIVMTLQFLQKAEQSSSDPVQQKKIKSMIFEAEQKLSKGYDKLLTYESSNGGYEWFGANPGHEALTAYGLMQFTEMKQLMPNKVSSDMIGRAQSWLVGRKDGKGGFHLSTQALDTFGRAPVNITNAYLVWTLSSLGYKRLDLEIEALVNTSRFSDDTYFLSLLSGILLNVGRIEESIEVSKRVAQYQNSTSGAVNGALTSITSSCGRGLILETTSLALINWLRLDRQVFADNIEKAIKFIIGSIEDGGRMGSTQSTILSLKALILYMDEYSGVKGKGDFNLYVDGYKTASISFDEGNQTDQKFDFRTPLLNSIQTLQSNNEHTIEIKLENYESYEENTQFQLSISFQLEYLDKNPPTAPDAKIEFNLRLLTPEDQEEIDTYRQQVEIINTSKEPQGMVVAIVSVPSCMKLDVNQFELLKQKGKFDSYEISSDLSQYTIYWTSIKEFSQETQEGKKSVDLTLVREYQAEQCLRRASVAYLYYDNENKIWL